MSTIEYSILTTGTSIELYLRYLYHVAVLALPSNELTVVPTADRSRYKTRYVYGKKSEKKYLIVYYICLLI